MAGEGRWTGVGNLGNDPEVKFLENGKAVATFSIANTPRVNRNGEWSDGETMWIRVTAWGRLAEGAAENLRKGSRVFVSGPMKQTSWTTKDGERRTGLELTVDDLEMGEVHLLKKAQPAAQEDSPW